MAEETENKQKFILNKKKNETPAAEPVEKKKVVVVKKKVAVVPAAAGTTEKKDKPEGQKIAVKKAADSAQAAKPAASAQKNVSAENGSVENSSSVTTQRNPVKTHSNAQRPSQTTFELSPSRPNVKMGNLADKGRGNNRDRYGSRNGQNG